MFSLFLTDQIYVKSAINKKSRNYHNTLPFGLMTSVFKILSCVGPHRANKNDNSAIIKWERLLIVYLNFGFSNIMQSCKHKVLLILWYRKSFENDIIFPKYS